MAAGLVMKAAEAYSDSVMVDPQDNKAVRRIIFKLAGPSLAEMLLINMTQMVMMILVGHLGAVAVAAVGLTSQPYMLMTVLFAALNTGTLYSTLIGVWGVRVLLSYLFVYIFSWGMFGLWNAVACDQFLRSNLIYFRFKRMIWKHVKI